jgi:predicted PurR-regulated permease PerM
MNTIEILTVVLLISSSVLCFALIYFIYQVVKSVHSISANIQGLSYKLNPLIQSTLVLSEKLTHITDEAESQLQISKSIVSDIRENADIIINMETKIRDGIEDTAIHLFKKFQALGKGVVSFWKYYKSK